MKKLYFLNEEESNRILKLHKDAAKKQYLSEQPEEVRGTPYNQQLMRNYQNPQSQIGQEVAVKKDVSPYGVKQPSAADARAAGWGPVTDDYASKLPVDANGDVIPPKKTTEPTVKPAGTTTVQSVNKPLVTKIQQVLKDKGISIGNTGPKKDGVDGVMGKLTLNAIIGLLGGGTTAPTGTVATTPTGTAATTAPTAATTATTGTATKDVNPEE